MHLRQFCLCYLFVLNHLGIGRTQEPTPEETDPKPSQEFYVLGSTHAAMSSGAFSGQGFKLTRRWYTWCLNATSYKYRTYDGSCNNVRNLGAALTAVPTLLKSEYADGMDAPRQYGTDGLPLPSARLVSTSVFPSVIEFTNRTHMVMQWGQWVIHDLSAIPISTGANGTIKCCGPNGQAPPFINNRNCFPIEIPAHDRISKGRCMEFVRSLAATSRLGIPLRPRQQINIITSFIDASQIYGSGTIQTNGLRYGGYLLKTGLHGALPKAETQNCIKRPNSTDYCQLAGDTRVNEQPGLGVIHTFWVREHNRISQQLRILKGNSSEEEIFQITRKIIAALQQIINYNEYLPIILGKDAHTWKLVSKVGRTAYNPALDPSVFSEFSTAAFRFGHSTIPDALSFSDKMVKMRHLLHRPAECLNNCEGIMAGLAGLVGKKYKRALKKVDRNFVREVTRFLFEAHASPGHKLDLAALNIQRGRDHGLAPYIKYRTFCGLPPVKGFDDEEALGPYVRDLALVYRSIADIDLYVGLLYEPVEGDASVGPTLKCLLGIQFFNLKFGDRFFFDSTDENLGFNDEQLASLRNMTLSKVMCHNSYLRELQLDVFTLPSKQNPTYPCQQLRSESLDLTLFA